jgi:FkbM family methyltransferase
MINFFKKLIDKRNLKRTFKEYGFEVEKFSLEEIGTVEYAQWLHPFESKKQIKTSNIRFYQKLAKPGAMIIDIGAHTGDTTVPMALAVGRGGLVLALEPNKYVYKILKKNAELNTDKMNIVPLCFAATSDDGEFTFNYSDASFCNGGFLSQIENQHHGHNYTLNVIGKNLQRYLLSNHKEDLKKLDLLKVDAEGYDKEILKTIPQIVHDYKPNLMIECYKRLNEDERFELFDLVRDFGYRLFLLENFEEFNELHEIHRENMNDKKHFEILAIHESKNLG